MRIDYPNFGSGLLNCLSGMSKAGGAALSNNDTKMFLQQLFNVSIPSFSDKPYTAGPANTCFHQPDGPNGSNGAYSEQEEKIRQNPDLLLEKGRDGMDIDGMPLETGPDGKLTEESKRQVNELIGNLSDKLGVEVSADVFKGEDGNMKVHLTSGTSNSVTHRPPQGTLYSAHTHPSGSSNPSNTDIANQIDGAEDAVVPCDGIAGNEDGADYNLFA